MTERLADVSARLSIIRRLGAVVAAMGGIAAARAQQARAQLAAVDRYAGTIAGAVAQAFALLPPPDGRPADTSRLALVLFCAEQGFAGAFSERVLDAAGPDLMTAALFVAGTRGDTAIAERRVASAWQGAMPSRSPGIPGFADEVLTAVYAAVADGRIDRLDTVYCEWRPGTGLRAVRRLLLPLDPTEFPAPVGSPAPLLNLTPAALLAPLTADHPHAQLCKAALHGFVAESQACMEAMAAAHVRTERQLASRQATERRVRQEEITAEIIELASGEAASRERAV